MSYPRPHATPVSRRLRGPALLGLLLATLTACGGESSYEVQEVRTSRPAAPATPTQAQVQWAYELPEGWSVLPPKRMVDVGFQVAGRDDTFCTFSILVGKSGGMLANVNRWRGQMGLEPVTQEAVDALPSAGPLLQHPAVEVDLVGTYGGMRGDTALEDARLLGWIVVQGRDAAFLKMVGPKDVVDAEREHFAAVGTSLRPERKLPPPSQPEMPAGHPPIEPELPSGHPPIDGGAPGTAPGMPGAGVPEGAPERPGALAWTAPETWVKQPAKRMREVTFAPKGAKEAEVYVSLAGGDLAMNINRWRGQMGQAPLTAAEIEGLHRIPVLGGEAYFVEIEGDFSGMGASDTSNALMYGIVLERPDQSVFVKMLGPKDEVAPERANFEAFVRSLRAN